MTNQVIKLLAESYLQNEDVSEWAIKCLEKGYDSKSLRMLCSMPNSLYSSSEIGDYYKRALKELDWDKISREAYLLSYAKILAKEIIEDKTDVIDASGYISSIHVNLEYPSELEAWFDIDEMIWEHNYSLKTGKKDGYFYRSKHEIIAIIKEASKELLHRT